MTYTLYFVLLGVSMAFLFTNHPVSLGLLLILHTLVISAVTGLSGGSFWFSYVLVLVFLGGVLVLFIYMTSLASNEKFNLGWGVFSVVIALLFLLSLGLLCYLLPSSVFNDSVSWDPQMPVGTGLVGLIMKLYSSESFKSTLLLILYLLYALVVCANMVGKYSGALRNFN